jgi:Ca2+/Na+ antiporter
MMLLFGLILIVVAGKFIGSTARALIIEFKIPAWMIGWLLGLVTSTPEMIGFFEIYRKHKTRGSLSGIQDTQEALDTLVSSNMCNLGIILPIGVYLLVLL